MTGLQTATVRIALMTLVLAVPFRLPAQETDSRAVVTGLDSLRLSTLLFDRSLNTYLWQGRLVLGERVSGIDIRLTQDLRSRLVRTAERAIQDEAATHVQIDSRLGGKLSGHGLFTSRMLADNRSADLGRLSEHRFLAGPGYAFGGGMHLHALGGFEIAAQEQIREQGPAFQVGLDGADFQWEGLAPEFALRSSRAFLDRRTPASDTARVRLQSRFGPSAANSVGMNFSRRQSEFYALTDSVTRVAFGIDRNIFRRVEEALEVADTLSYAPNRRVRMLVHGGIANRTIDRGYRYKAFRPGAQTQLDTRIRELRFSGGVSSVVQPWNGAEGRFALQFEERDERHSVRDDPEASEVLLDQQERIARRLGNVARRTSVLGGLGWRLGSRDSLQVSGSANILRYDTPDTLNTDDRDEALFTVGIQEQHRLSDVLTATAALDVTLSHLVYLHRLQSANNVWNRVLALRLRVDYTPAAWLTNVLVSEVLANYTVYDFEEQIRSVRSYSFRQAVWVDSVSAQFTDRLGMEVAASLRMFERGLLKWREFTERPENLFLEISFWPRMIVRALPALLISAGYRHFSQDRYRYEGEQRALERRFTRAGPTATVLWDGGGWRRLAIEGWREVQKDGARTVRTVSNLSISVGILL